MEEEKLVNKIVDEIMTNVKGRKYEIFSNTLDNNIQQYNNKEILLSSTKEKNKEKDDLIKRLNGKKERRSKTVINNNYTELYLVQEKNDNRGWNVYIKDFDQRRFEKEEFGNNYKDAEKYYSILFFKYHFDEIKKNDNKKFGYYYDDYKYKFIEDEDHREIIEEGEKFSPMEDAIIGIFGFGLLSSFFGAGIAVPVSCFSPQIAAIEIVITTIIGSIAGGIYSFVDSKSRNSE